MTALIHRQDRIIIDGNTRHQLASKGHGKYFDLIIR